jgi:tetratricopeptide (TPR) repeat protein
MSGSKRGPWLIAAGIAIAGSVAALSGTLSGTALKQPGLTEARAFAETHQVAAALRIVADTLPGKPDDTATLALLGDLYADLCDPTTGEPVPGNAAPAVQRIAMTLRETVRLHPESTEDRALLGEYALAAGQDSVAITVLSGANRPDASMGPLTVPLALALLRTGRFDQLVETINPNDALGIRSRSQALHARARALESLRKYDDARSNLVAILWRDPDNLAAKAALGLLELEHGSRDAATYWLGQARAADPDAPATLALAGNHAFVTRDYAASADAFGKLVSRQAAHAVDGIPPGLGKARALIYLGDLPTARVALEGASLPSDDARLSYYRALLAYRAGAFARAAELAEGLAVRLPDFPPIDLLMGGTMLATGFPETAARHLRRYLAAEPDDAGARALLDEAEQRLMHPNQTTPVPNQLLFHAFGFDAPPTKVSDIKF